MIGAFPVPIAIQASLQFGPRPRDPFHHPTFASSATPPRVLLMSPCRRSLAPSPFPLSFALALALLGLSAHPGSAAPDTTASTHPTPAPLPDAHWSKLPPWRGFNLLNFFQRDWGHRPFDESEFSLLHRLGFNFVRIPIDYRILVSPTNWTQFNPAALDRLDRALEFGERHGIHVCLNFHRIPGYTVASPPETRSLFTDPEAQAAAALHWATLAKRYAGRPNSHLSFNLFNEPPDITPAVYSNIAAQLVTAIRAADPDRLIIADGLNYGRTPVPELIPLQIAQATRGYSPFGLTHYRASWVNGADAWPVPVWPASRVNAYLYGPAKPEFRSTLNIRGLFPVETTLRIHVNQVSAQSRLVIRANNVLIFNHNFLPGPGTGEWDEVVFQPQWNTYQNFYRRDYTATIPVGTTNLTIANAEGDWMTFRDIGLRPSTPGAPEILLRPGTTDWGQRQIAVVDYQAQHPTQPLRYSADFGREWLWEDAIQPWVNLRDRGVGVMVGEWGAHNQTPHPVTLAWMRDMLINYQRAGFGWALWNFGGSFGPLDSDRPDVSYQNLEGRRVDQAMLQLLQEFTGRREAFFQWQHRTLPPDRFPEALRTPNADPSGQGIPNAFAYASGMDPLQPTRQDLPHWIPLPDTGELELRYRISLREVGSRFRVLTSPDLLHWQEFAGPPRILQTYPDHQWQAVRLPTSTTPLLFSRLLVEVHP